MNQEFKNYIAVSWDKVLSNKEDILKLFEELDLQDLDDIQIISRTYSQDNRLIMLITANKTNSPRKIIIDATSGIPTWQQFINVTYDDGKSTDVKVILYGKDYEGFSFDLPAGGIFDLSNLVKRNNKCGVETYLVKGVAVDHNSQKALNTCFIEEEPADADIDKKLKLPQKIEIQKAEFWAGYYYPNWEMQGGELIDADDDITGDWNPGYSLYNGLSTKAVWNSDGFFIDLIGEPDSEAIKWIWTNRKSLFDNAYPDCSIDLKSEDNKPYAISVKVLDIPIEELIKMEPKNKWEYGEVVYGEEHKFSSIADNVIEDFDEENKASKKTAVA
jgi:hypothetical protein